MKKYFLHLAVALLAGAGLTTACSDDPEENLPVEPVFPAAKTATVLAGDTYNLEIESNVDWEVRIPDESAEWFWIIDGTQKTYSVHGKAFEKTTVTIGVSDVEEFDTEHSCEVRMTAAEQTKTIATLTIGTAERTLALYAGRLDEDGNFVYSEEGDLRYVYGETPAETIDLTWPAGLSGYMYPIMVEANFAWRLAEKSEWIRDMNIAGNPGEKTEIRLEADPTKYPLDGDKEGKLVLCAVSNPEKTYEYTVTIPACRDHFAVSDFVAESRFNAQGQFFSAGSSSAGAWVEGGAHGNIVSVEEPVIYKFAEVTEGDISYLDADQASWIKIENTLSDAENVLKDRRYTITVEENTNAEARNGVILALPKSVADKLEGAWELAEMDIKEEYRQYIVTRVNQAAKPDLVSAVNPEGMAEVGAALERLDPDNYGFIMEGFGVTDGFNLIYTAAWSNEDSTLAFDREYTSYKCYDYEWNEMTGTDSWLSVRKVANGTVIDMDPDKDKCGNSSQMNEGVAHAGFIVFADAEGDFVVIRCVYDENASLGGDDGEIKVAFYYPEYAMQFDESTLELLTEGELFEEYNPGNGSPVYHLTYRKPFASMSMLKGLSSVTMGAPNAEWLEYEPNGDMMIITMNAEALEGDAKTMTSSIVFYNSSWETAVTLVCTLDLTNYTEDDE
ncbi:MAG: hypothetical protein NC209_01885 [Alistipes sp.]|nr:hypothetical protein [Alistipes senegalensis]MCM1249879.1 hypothetical protein [Alistipes sp.]